jgi:hypothetical protein
MLIIVDGGNIGFLLHESGEHHLVVQINGVHGSKSPNTLPARWQHGLTWDWRVADK